MLLKPLFTPEGGYWDKDTYLPNFCLFVFKCVFCSQGQDIPLSSTVNTSVSQSEY